MRILISGGAGFIGSQVADRCIELGHEVVIIDDLSTGRRKFVHPKAAFYQVDIRDRRKVEEVFSNHKVDVLSHHAAQMDVRKSVADPVFDADVNLIGLLNLMEAGRKQGLKKVIFASSGGTIYGESNMLPTPESVKPRPASPYGVAKLASEYYLDYYYQVYSIQYVSLRYANVYGPRQNPHGEAGAVAIFTKKMLKGEQSVINGDGRQTRDFVYVSDVVRANELALEMQKPLIVNIGTGIETNVNTLFREISKLTNNSSSEKHGPAKRGEQLRSALDNSLAQQTLGWQSQVDLKRGLQLTLEYFKHE